MSRLLLLTFLTAACAPEQPGREDRIDLNGIPDNVVGNDDGEDVVEVFFTRPGTEPGGEEDPELDDALVALIEASTTTLDICLYEFDLESIIDATLHAYERGVVIRFAGDGDEVEDLGYEELEAAGIEISYRKANDRIMHNKFVVADEQVVWTGTTNITHNGVFRNNNASLLIENTQLAQHYTAEFEQMFVDGHYGRKKQDLGEDHIVDFRGDTLEFYFSPEHDPIHQVAAQIDQAEHSVHFLIFSFTHSDITDALERAVARGVEVVGIFDESQAYGRYSKDEYLAEAGIPVYIDGNGNASGFSGGKLHHKTLVVDAGSDAIPTVVTGSVNWSKNATNYNDENLLVLRDPALVSLYSQEFCSLLDEATLHPNYLGPVPRPCSDAKQKVFINEFLPNPSGTDTGKEFVEIVNGSNAIVNLTGWTLGDALASARHTFDGIRLEPGEAVVVFDSGDHADVTNAVNADTGKLSLNNAGDVITLADSNGMPISRVEYSSTRVGISWNRDPDVTFDGSWDHHSRIEGSATLSSPGLRVDGTPFGAELDEVDSPDEIEEPDNNENPDEVENPDDTPPRLIINEALPNPDGTDRGEEFLELVNIGEVAVDLTGWTLSDVQQVRHEFQGTMLEPGEHVVVYDRGDNHSDIPGAILSSTTYLSLNNSAETISLHDATGALHDSVSWTDCEAGVSLNRATDGTDSAQLVDHTTLSDLPQSPGTQASGEIW